MNGIFVLVFGNPIQGATIYGPFESSGEAHDSNGELGLPFYYVQSITIEDSNQNLTKDFLNSEEIYTLAVGDPFAGMELIGLYDTRESAYDSASTKGDDWYIVKIKSLKQVREEQSVNLGIVDGMKIPVVSPN